MQDCFRKYPEIYGSELSDEEGEESPEPPATGEEDALAPKTDKNESQEISELPAVGAPKTEKKMPAAPSKSTSAPKIDRVAMP
jgi:intermembrane space import and assembly protein 40